MGGRDDDEVRPMDPVALTLAVWLGVIVSVTGLIRLSEHAAAQAALSQANAGPVSGPADARAVSLRLMAFGG